MHVRLSLPELREVLAASEALAATAEGAGLRPAAPLRPALHQLCKAWLDALHARSMQQLNCARHRFSALHVVGSILRVLMVGGRSKTLGKCTK